MSTAFYDTIEALRQSEHVLLFDKLLVISPQAAEQVSHFLAQEYAQEALEYPFEAPAFDPKAALWAASNIYFACQLLLHRDLDKSDLSALLPAYNAAPTPAAILSADLCLRFLPAIISQCRALAPEDVMIPILENQLKTWHYSGIRCCTEPDELDFALYLQQDCLRQLYINRIIEHKNLSLAALPVWNEGIKASLGDYGKIFWRELG